MLDGENIGRYSIDWDGNWLDYLPDELYNPKSPAVLDVAKILIKRIAPSLTVVPDLGSDGQYFYALNTIYALIPKTKLELSFSYVSALLNSKFLDWYYKLLFEAIAIRGGYIEYREFLRYLPIHGIDFTTLNAKRSAQAEKAKRLYEQSVGSGDWHNVLDFVEGELHTSREDVVHDFLAFLAEWMMETNADKRTTF